MAELDEGVVQFSPLELEERVKTGVTVDVREQVEMNELMFPFAARELHSIPLTELRERLDEIPFDQDLTILCMRGTRSSEAVRIFKQKGAEKVAYMGGGLGFYQ